MFLTPIELVDLTGLHRPSAQLRWLRERGWPHEVTARGSPRVLRAYVEQRLSGLKAVAVPQRSRPNLAAVKV